MSTSQIRIHSTDSRRPVLSLDLPYGRGTLLSVALFLLSLVVLAGLMVAPDMVTQLARSAARMTAREEARRGREAFESVVRHFDRLGRRVALDELFLFRLGDLAGVQAPPDFPSDLPAKTPESADAAEREVTLLERRLRRLESHRRALAAATPAHAPDRIPARSPVEPSSAVLSARYGPTPSLVGRGTEFHAGIDLAAVAGTPVVAPAAGRVVFAGAVPTHLGSEWRRLGTIVVVAHDAETRTVFGHLRSVAVRPGRLVKRGDALGTVGQSGWSPSPHVHYEVRRRRGGAFVPLDPRLFILDAEWLTAAEARGPIPPPTGYDLPRKLW